MKKIFVTGASGCVGHYLFDILSSNPDYQLYLLVRDPDKLKFDPEAFPNVAVIKDDLKNIEKHADLLKEVDYVLHLAADWGGHEGNLDYSLNLFNLLNPESCQKVVYFSTASILGSDNQPLKEAEIIGTHYIRSKYQIYKKLPELKIYPRVVTLFPTWVLGGDARHPYSHASAGILAMRSWLWLIRFFTADASFHFIHARDLALVVKHLLENDVKAKEYVLGNTPITAGEFIRRTCEFFNQRVYFQIPISLSLARFLAFITGRRLHPWDLYCFNKRHFEYKAAAAASFGIKSNLQTVEEILSDMVRP